MNYFLVNSFVNSSDGKGVFSNSEDYINNGYWKISKDSFIDDRQVKLAETLFTFVEVGDVLVLKEDSTSRNHSMRTVKALGRVTKIDDNAYKFKVNWFNQNSWRTKHEKLNYQLKGQTSLLISPIDTDNFCGLLFLKKILEHMVRCTN